MSGAVVSTELQFLSDAPQVRERVEARVSSKRIEAIDLARGIAVALMILSHGVKGLLDFEAIPSWGLVPIHLITKFSSSLFILVFGVSLAAVFLPVVGTDRWPQKRNKLLVRGLVIFFWYKVLTIVEMIHLYSREDIIATLTYRAFPVYVEILGFYAIALIWVPLVLPMWKRLGTMWKVTAIATMAIGSNLLYHHFHFWGSEVLQAILVEHEKHYTWGQLSRAPLVFMGLMIGEALVVARANGRKIEWISAFALISVAGLFFYLFSLLAGTDLANALHSVAMNEGKHPPQQSFMLFSLAGAFAVLGLAIAGGHWLSVLLKPFAIIGKDALQAFIFHIFVIFVFYRYLFDLWRNIPYSTALALSCLLIAMTALWVQTTSWVRKMR